MGFLDPERCATLICKKTRFFLRQRTFYKTPKTFIEEKGKQGSDADLKIDS